MDRQDLTAAVLVHNGEAQLAETLRALSMQDSPEGVRILVICNGCQDRSVEIARDAACLFDGPMIYQVLDLPAIGRGAALRVAIQKCKGALAVLDQDTLLSPGAFSAIRDTFRSGYRFAALQPKPGRSPSPLVRAYYRFWLALDYVRRSPATIGFYAVSADGLGRVADLPPIHSDDKYMRLRFAPAERVRIDSESYRVDPQQSFAALIRDRARYNRGNRELARLLPAGAGADAPRHARADWLVALRQPGDCLAFAATILLSRLYAALPRL